MHTLDSLSLMLRVSRLMRNLFTTTTTNAMQELKQVRFRFLRQMIKLAVLNFWRARLEDTPCLR